MRESVYSTNIVCAEPTTDEKNLAFAEKSDNLRNTIYSYIDTNKRKPSRHFQHQIFYNSFFNLIKSDVAAVAITPSHLGSHNIFFTETIPFADVNFNRAEELFIELSDLSTCIQSNKEHINENVFTFCLANNLDASFPKVYSLIKNSFKNLVKINVQLYDDHEITDYAKVVFEIFVDDAIERILEMQDIFYINLVDAIRKNKIKYFILKCEKYGTI